MKVRWTEKAIDDRIAIFDRISPDNFEAAVRLDDEIVAQVLSLDEFPELGREGRSENTRELMIAGTRYIAAYVITDRAIEVLRIMHGSQEWPNNIRED